MKPISFSANALFSFLLLVCLLQLFFSSCKKELEAKKAAIVETTDPQLFHHEQAYPNEQGKLLKTKFHGVEIDVEKKREYYIWMGDIAFDQETFDSLNKTASVANRTFRPTINNHWYRGEVFFIIQPDFTAAERTRINDAITHWQNNTSLRFTQRTNQPNFIRFVRGGVGAGFSSNFVGMKGGEQTITLEQTIFTFGNTIHEIGHAIGFYHEQSRTDRGNAIIVNYNNIFPNTQQNIYQFNTYTQNGLPGAQLGAFDFNSVMLYGSFAFSNPTNPQPTITRLDGSLFIGQRVGLSVGDIETSNFIYGPTFARLVYHQSYIIEEYGNVNEFVREEGGYTVNFFADAACTIPVTLPQQRTVSYYTYSSGYTGGILNSITLQPGQHAYDIPAAYYYEYRAEYGNIISYQSSSAGQGLDGYWR